jgi:hypothetical protein
LEELLAAISASQAAQSNIAQPLETAISAFAGLEKTICDHINQLLDRIQPSHDSQTAPGPEIVTSGSPTDTVK